MARLQNKKKILFFNLPWYYQLLNTFVILFLIWGTAVFIVNTIETPIMCTLGTSFLVFNIIFQFRFSFCQYIYIDFAKQKMTIQHGLSPRNYTTIALSEVDRIRFREGQSFKKVQRCLYDLVLIRGDNARVVKMFNDRAAEFRWEIPDFVFRSQVKRFSKLENRCNEYLSNKKIQQPTVEPTEQ